jgi:type IV fimbrial biogenesis protein FimT
MRNTQHGFTMVEMVVVICIVSILIATGVPSYRYITTSNRIAAEINALVGDLQFARAQAIKEGRTVTVCASNDGLTCIGAGSAWTTGWIVFLDANSNGTYDAGTDGTAMRVQGGVTTDSLVADSSTTSVTFNREGFATGLPGGGLTVRVHEPTGNRGFTRCLAITIVGAMSTQKYGTGNCT